MLWEAGITINETPKIHKEDANIDDHALILPEMGFRILLSLWGIFFYFCMSKPYMRDIGGPARCLHPNTNKLNPCLDMYSINEESMLEWEGNIQQPNACLSQIVLDKIHSDATMVTSLNHWQGGR